MIFNLSKSNHIANIFVAQLRDEHIQNDRMRFRRNLERLGEYFAFEISKDLAYQETETATPLGTAKTQKLVSQLVIATILRAGLPMQQGLLNIFDTADSAFITAYRKHNPGGDFIIQLDHIAAPNLEDKTIIIADPMLASGLSIVKCAKALISRQKITALHIVSAIASKEGIAYVRANLPHAKIWVGAIDDEMTSKSYIVPGLGDAGDLAYGPKT